MLALLACALDHLDLRENHIAFEVLLIFSILQELAEFVRVPATVLCILGYVVEQLNESLSQVFRVVSLCALRELDNSIQHLLN